MAFALTAAACGLVRLLKLLGKPVVALKRRNAPCPSLRARALHIQCALGNPPPAPTTTPCHRKAT